MQLVVVSAVMAAVIIAEMICQMRIQVSFEIFIAKSSYLLISWWKVLAPSTLHQKPTCLILNQIFFISARSASFTGRVVKGESFSSFLRAEAARPLVAFTKRSD